MSTDFAAASPDSPDARAFYDPPQDEFLERGVLGSLLAQPDRDHAEQLLTDLKGFLDPIDFFRDLNRMTLTLILHLSRQLSDGVLIGDLFRAPRTPALSSAYLTALAAESLDALIVRDSAIRVAELGLQRRIEYMSHRLRGATPESIAIFNSQVQQKRTRIEQAKSGATAGDSAKPYSPLTSEWGGQG